MRRTKHIRVIKLMARVILAALLICIAAVGSCFAQSYSSPLSSVFRLSAIESIIGPICPPGGFASTFRSEVGTGAYIGGIVSAKLTGATSGEFDLVNMAFLDQNPLRYDTYATLRIWRLGLRGTYSNAETRSHSVNGAHVDFTGLSLGGDVDAVQLKWMTLGASIDFYFINPTFQGLFISNPGSTTPEGLNPATIDLVGNRPITLGAYLRYVPPEILGFPVHVEAMYKFPISGSQWTILNAALVFRPQIYRFDISCKLIGEYDRLKFQNGAETLALGLPGSSPYTLSPQTWELNMEWGYFGIDFAAYF
ncbi:MAG: hypothetical protein WBG50_10280 [Desulfomonilaceae bacterium]